MWPVTRQRLCNYIRRKFRRLAYIIAQLNNPGSGEVYINAYSDLGYWSNMYVYISPDDQNWYSLPGGFQTICSSEASYIDCGSASQAMCGPIDYVMVVGYDSAYSVSLHIDSIQLIDNPTVTVQAWDEYQYSDQYNDIFWQYDNLNANVYMGSPAVSVGTTTCTIQVSDGVHYVSFDNWMWDNTWEVGCTLIAIYCPDNGQYYTNGQNIDINYNMRLFLVYYDNDYM